jgi:aminopeptidase N
MIQNSSCATLSQKWQALSGIVLIFMPLLVFSQSTFTRQDSLRGSITPEREWWDLNYYHLTVDVDPTKKSIIGSNEIRYQVLNTGTRLQLDLQEPLVLETATQEGEALTFERDGNAYFISLTKDQKPGAYETLIVTYSGIPRVAKRAPWDGGFSWNEDANGNAFVATSCQGLGASAWWPVKDHMYDEPDSMAISITVPKPLIDVSNGQLRSVVDNGSTRTFNWFVSNPINNYGVNINLGNYTHFGETFEGENGPLQLDYYVLPEDLEKAKSQFQQTKPMLEAFEHWFGPYPFYEDGFKLVQVPYLGMEHQSSVTYGNRFENGYLGRDLSGTGWGLKFDFIIIHESGHEWFANNITYKDAADMWIH